MEWVSAQLSLVCVFHCLVVFQVTINTGWIISLQWVTPSLSIDFLMVHYGSRHTLPPHSPFPLPLLHPLTLPLPPPSPHLLPATEV